MKNDWKILLVAVLSLSGCATWSPQTVRTDIPIPSSERKTNQIQAWNVRGKIAVNSAQKGWNASFDWQQHLNFYRLTIFGPLGTYPISLNVQREGATLTTATCTYQATDAEQLLKKQLGWSIPVDAIYYWIRGLPAPGEIHAVTHNHQGQVISFMQQGWQVTYETYARINGFELPSFIVFQNHDLRIKIIVYQWEI